MNIFKYCILSLSQITPPSKCWKILEEWHQSFCLFLIKIIITATIMKANHPETMTTKTECGSLLAWHFLQIGLELEICLRLCWSNSLPAGRADLQTSLVLGNSYPTLFYTRCTGNFWLNLWARVYTTLNLALCRIWLCRAVGRYPVSTDYIISLKILKKCYENTKILKWKSKEMLHMTSIIPFGVGFLIGFDRHWRDSW